MENRKRSVVKSITWRVIATVITIVFSYIWLGEWGASIALGISINVLKVFFYYLHERGWNLIHWGRKTIAVNSRENYAGNPGSNPGSDHIGVTIWFTGLPSSGKTTIAEALAEMLRKMGYKVERLDGDIIRKNLWKELGFSKEDRDENIRRAAYLAGVFTRNGIMTLTTFISPYRELRQHARDSIGNFIEVYVKCPVEKCMERDPKGLYKKALAGEIKNFTGISDPYEEPLNPEVLIESDKETVEDGITKIMDCLKELGYI